MQSNPVKRRANRFWLYGPTALLFLFAVGWSVGWFVMRGKAEAMIDAQLAREAASGRNWSCLDRTIKGFPFRFEMNCAALSFRNSLVNASLGPTKIITQIYDPRHVILEADGPLQFTDGKVTASGTWKSFEASVAGIGSGGFERLSLVTKQSSFTVSGLPEIAQTGFSADETGLHIRPTPGVGAGEDSFDIAVSANRAVVPLLNVWMGDDEPLQVESQATLSRALALRALVLPEALENWRSQGGMLRIAKLDTRKGLRLLNLKGDVSLDEMHRVEATIEVAQANYSDLLAQLTSSGERRALQPLPPEAAGTPVSPLPPIELSDGKVKVAMFTVPKVRLAPLY